MPYPQKKKKLPPAPRDRRPPKRKSVRSAAPSEDLLAARFGIPEPSGKRGALNRKLHKKQQWKSSIRSGRPTECRIRLRSTVPRQCTAQLGPLCSRRGLSGKAQSAQGDRQKCRIRLRSTVPRQCPAQLGPLCSRRGLSGKAQSAQ